MLQHHLAAEIQRLSAENQKLHERLLAIDHEEIERSRPRPQPRRRPQSRRRRRPTSPLGAILPQVDPHALIRAVAEDVGLYGSAAEIEQQAARAARSALGPLGVYGSGRRRSASGAGGTRTGDHGSAGEPR